LVKVDQLIDVSCIKSICISVSSRTNILFAGILTFSLSCSTKYVDMIHLVNKLVTPSYSSATLLPIMPVKLTLRTYSVNLGGE
jgi:hypothetical protein